MPVVLIGLNARGGGGGARLYGSFPDVSCFCVLRLWRSGLGVLEFAIDYAWFKDPKLYVR